MTTALFTIYLFLFRLVVPRAMVLNKSQRRYGRQRQRRKGWLGRETDQLNYHGIEQHMRATSFAIPSFLFSLVGAIAMNMKLR